MSPLILTVFSPVYPAACLRGVACNPMTVPLADLFAHHATDKLLHGYAPYYARHLSHLASRSCIVVELGVYQGASLLAWADWLPLAYVIGIDTAELPPDISDHPAIAYHQADVTSPVPDLPAPDAVIDDASHDPVQVEASFNWLWPVLQPGGWYVIEDLCADDFALARSLTWLYTHPDVCEVHLYPTIHPAHSGFPGIVFVRKGGTDG